MRSKNNVIKLAKRDFTGGILSQWKKFLFAALTFAFASGVFYTLAQASAQEGNIHSTPTLLDALIYIFRGMEVYVPAPDKPFEVPAIWMLMNLFLAFIIVSYPSKDLNGYGQHMLLHARSRLQWWAGKCIWNVCCVIVFYLIGFAVILLFTVFAGGKVSFQASGEICQQISQFHADNVAGSYLMRTVLVLPILTSLALSLLQMALEFLFRPILSYAIILTVLVASAYYCTPFLLGNESMLLRSKAAMPDGIPFSLSVVIDGAVILAAPVLGYLRFRKSDLLEKA